MTLPSVSEQTYLSIEALKSDSERLTLLFSPFRARSLNPEHYDEKMKFWHRMIKEFSESEKKLCFSFKEVEQKLLPLCGKKPACLKEVFENIAKEGQIVSFEEFKASSIRSSSSWYGWSAYMLKWSLNKLWTLNPIILNSASKIKEDTNFVYLPQLLSLEKLISNSPALSNKVMSIQEFKNVITSLTGLVEDLDIVLKHLRASGKLLTDVIRDIELVKFVSSPSRGSSAVISPVEKGRYDIHRTITILEQDLEKLVEKRDQAESRTRIALKEGKRATAKSHLKSQKLTESRIEKMTNVLDKLSAIAVQIDDAESDAKVIQAYEVGKMTLDQILKDNNLTTDRVNDVMLDIQDLMDEQADISTAISQPFDDEDTTLLEQELEEMLKDKQETITKGEKVESKEEETIKKLQKLKISGVDELSISSEPEVTF